MNERLTAMETVERQNKHDSQARMVDRPFMQKLRDNATQQAEWSSSQNIVGAFSNLATAADSVDAILASRETEDTELRKVG